MDSSNEEEKFLMKKDRILHKKSIKKTYFLESAFSFKDHGYNKALHITSYHKNLLKIFFGYLDFLKVDKKEILNIISHKLTEDNLIIFTNIEYILINKIKIFEKILESLKE